MKTSAMATATALPIQALLALCPSPPLRVRRLPMWMSRSVFPRLAASVVAEVVAEAEVTIRPVDVEVRIPRPRRVLVPSLPSKGGEVRRQPPLSLISPSSVVLLAAVVS